MLSTVKALFSAIVDYAGLFPPAQLSLETAMAKYVQYQASPHAWMLGRFVLPVSRLEEFVSLVPTFSRQPWPLSLIISRNLETELDQVQSLRLTDSAIAIQALEFPPLTPDTIAALDLPPQVETFFEIQLDQDVTPYLAELRNRGASAKIRTGGITAAAFPSAAQLCEFIFACAQAQVSFKATAGLHHPLPSHYPLTYEPESAIAAMFGFLSVGLVAALAYCHKISSAEAFKLLQEASTDHLHLTDQTLSWNQHQLNELELTTARQQLFRSFGSCSFAEPIAGLKAIQWLEPDAENLR